MADAYAASPQQQRQHTDYAIPGQQYLDQGEPTSTPTRNHTAEEMIARLKRYRNFSIGFQTTVMFIFLALFIYFLVTIRNNHGYEDVDWARKWYVFLMIALFVIDIICIAYTWHYYQSRIRFIRENPQSVLAAVSIVPGFVTFSQPAPLANPPPYQQQPYKPFAPEQQHQYPPPQYPPGYYHNGQFPPPPPPPPPAATSTAEYPNNPTTAGAPPYSKEPYSPYHTDRPNH
ncbi:hypothetical protein EV182_000321 [Spiromyces aspiralis]|uniref:Uncharacterized protein n=1 Tax=Spiromyces aspiralis TaxID=68401 RepID=A0ACC1HUJ5_9FUNG|nr:hypothetical protein EV182_000321 [Spiromyces aspiralis]